MQGCCSHRESPSSLRKTSQAFSGLNHSKKWFCAFGIETPAVPANCSFAIATVIERGCRACYYLRLDRDGQPRRVRRPSFSESSSPLKDTGLCGAILTAPFRVSELDQRRQFEKAAIIRGRTLLTKCRSEKLTEQVAKSRGTRSLGSELCRIPQPGARA